MFFNNKRNTLNRNFNGNGNINSLYSNTYTINKKKSDLSIRYEHIFSNKERIYKKQLKSNDYKRYDYKSQISCIPISNKRIEPKKYNKSISNTTSKTFMDYYVFKDDINLPGKCRRSTNKNIKEVDPYKIELNRCRLTNDQIMQSKLRNTNIKSKKGPRKIVREYKNLEDKNYIKNNKIKTHNKNLQSSNFIDKPIKKLHQNKINLYRSSFKIE